MSRSERLRVPSVSVWERASVARRPGVRALALDLLLFASVAALLFAGVSWSYRQPLHYDLPLTALDGLPRDGLGLAEYGGSEGPFRWAAPYTLVRFPAVGRAPHTISIAVHNPREAGPRTLSIGSTTRAATVTLRPGWQRLAVIIPPARIDSRSGDLALVLRVDRPIRVGQHEQGVAVRALELRQIGPASPPPDLSRGLLLLLGVIYVPLRLLGAPRRWTGLALTGLALLVIALLATQRIAVTQTLPAARLALLLALPGALLLWGWSRRQPVSARPWATAVAITTPSLFVLHFGGLRHPRFEPIDHILRVHQIMTIAEGGRERVQDALSRQYEWGDDARVPYSLLSYDLFVPLAAFVTPMHLRLVVEAAAAAAGASVIVLVWSVARRAGLTIAQSGWSALLIALFPVVHLYHHDGSFPTILGLAATVLALRLLLDLTRRPTWWRLLLSGAAIMLSLLLYVTHLIFVPLLVGLIALGWWWRGDAVQRRGAGWALAALGLGVGGALLSYYGAYLPTLLVETLPRYVATLRAEGSVGRNAATLPEPLLGGPLEQAWGHYRLVGLALALAGAGLAWRVRAGPWSGIVLGYAGFVALTLVVDLWFGLWNKHLYFALPGVALGAGTVLGAWQDRGGAARRVAWLVGAYLGLASVTAWGLRVLHYVWSLQTL